MKKKAIVMSLKDNVATALADLAAEETVETEVNGQKTHVTLTEPIAFGHKYSLTLIKAGEPVMKYGEVIGRATQDIQPGRHAHVHNVAGTRGRGDAEKEGGE
jgi:altronate dehydratase small subunit